MHCHLVPIEVGVERLANERVDLNCLAFYQGRLESLDTKSVQRWCTVQQNGSILDYLFKYVPDLGSSPLHHPLGTLDVVRVTTDNQCVHDKWFK